MTIILVVDDEPSTNALAVEYLRLAGFETASARDAQTALDLLAGGLRPGLIVVDRRLPDIDGLELCARIKAEPGLADLPLLMVSAYNSPPAEVRTSAGPDAWLAKPFRPKRLADEIRRLLRRND